MQIFIDNLNSFLAGPIVVSVIIFVGIIITVKTKFVQITCFREMLSHTFHGIFGKKSSNGDKNSVSGWQVATAALSGTIGTGNIVGVAAAIIYGGPGSIFWMWVSAFFGMATKYYEIKKSIEYRQTTKNGYVGGPMYYMKNGIHSPIMAGIFCVLCVLASFGIGNMVQVSAVGGAVSLITQTESVILPILLASVVGFIIIGGITRIARFTELVTPFMAVFYTLGCVIILVLNIDRLLDVFCLIISDAFSLKPAIGGTGAYVITRAIKTGFAKGVFTNEAGLGSAPIVHASSNEKSPHKQGLWGIFEVFFDTIFMCSLTAFVILLSNVDFTSYSESHLTINAFSVYFGDFTKYFLAISLLFFAVSSMVSWSYYGQTATLYLTNSKSMVLLYKVLFITVIYISFSLSSSFVWGYSDLFNGLMLIPNIITLALLSFKEKS